MNYASGEEPMIGDVIECAEPGSIGDPKHRIYRVTSLRPDINCIRVGDSRGWDAGRFKLIRRKPEPQPATDPKPVVKNARDKHWDMRELGDAINRGFENAIAEIATIWPNDEVEILRRAKGLVTINALLEIQRAMLASGPRASDSLGDLEELRTRGQDE